MVGGVAGYGTGALMPLVLVPILGPEPVVPIIAISGLLTNSGRVFAFLRHVDWRRSAIALVGAIPSVIVSAYGFTLLTGRAVQFLIGAMLILTVPLRYAMRRRATLLGDGGLCFSSMGYGAVMGGTVGAGVILLSILMSTGLQGAAVVATDAVISIVVGIVRLSVFGYAGVVTRAGRRVRTADRGRRLHRRVPGQGLRRAAAGAGAHRDPRRGGADRRRR